MSNTRKSLTETESLILEHLEQLFVKQYTHTLLAGLWQMGLINAKAVEAIAIKREVERLKEQGVTIRRAMEDTAYKYCCSYEKVRKIIYG